MQSKQIHKNITIVNENDRVVGAMQLPEAIEKGLIRSGVRVFVFSDENKVLLQKRSAEVRHPLELGMSADGHVDEGEDRVTAAMRELEEETGIRVDILTTIEKSFPSPGTINGVYKVTVPHNTTLKRQKSEVEELRWVTVEELDTLVNYHSSSCTKALVDTWKQLKNDLITG
jgi:ADP-ribose pyrophosphatase